MNWCRIIIGFIFSVIGGHLILWPLMDKVLWPHLGRVRNENKKPLSGFVGIVERFLYTAALFVGAWQWIGIWLAIKVVARWQSTTSDHEKEIPGSDNAWLIGTGLNVLFGYIGAWIVTGKLLLINKP
jgi:hypothetical protein